MIFMNFSIQPPSRTNVNRPRPMSAKRSLTSPLNNKSDSVSLRFGAEEFVSREELKQCLRLGPSATDKEFQEARIKELATIFVNRGAPAKVSTKAELTSTLGLAHNSTKEDILKVLKLLIKSQNPTLTNKGIAQLCALTLAYPTPHPFDYPGKKLG